MKYELYKLFVKRRAWLFILIFMMLRLFTVFLQPNYASNYKMEMYRDAYMHHMEVLQGKLNDEKAAYISEQNRKIQELLKQDTSIDDYVNGKISEEEFNERYRQRDMGYQQQEEFEVINEQYQSVLQDPEHIYFVYPNGWAGLIGNDSLDFVLLILLMLLIVPMICNEFSTDMYSILRTTVNGGTRLFVSKFAAGMITAILSAVLLFAVEVIYFATVLGLPGGSFPVQSLPPFAHSPYQVSIFGAAALTLLNHCFGAMFLSALLMCLSALLKRSLSAIFLGTTGILVPFILFSESVKKYTFPTPLGFFLSSGFLKGYFTITPFSSDYVTITPKQYITTICISLGLMLILFLIGILAFSGIRIRKVRKKMLSCMLCIPFFFLAGCTREETAELNFDGFFYDKWSYQPVNNEFSVVRDDNNLACLSYKNSSELVPLIHDCFTEQDGFSNATITFVDGEIVYYLNQYVSSQYEIIALDTRDFSERSVHKVIWPDNGEKMDMLFGLGYYLPKKKAQDEVVDGFFVHDDQLFVSKSHGIYWYDLHSGKQICIYDKQSDNFAFTCGSVYYTDDVLDVYRYDIQTKSTSKLPVGKAEHLYAAEDGLYFKALLDGKFYFVHADGSQKEYLPDFKEEDFMINF